MNEFAGSSNMNNYIIVSWRVGLTKGDTFYRYNSIQQHYIVLFETILFYTIQ